MEKNTAATHLSARYREGDGKSLSHCLHGETLERQPEMFERLTGVSTLVLFVRSRDVAAIAAALRLLLCCCSCAAAAVLLLLCCCCCAAASAAPRSAIHRCSTIRDADPRFIYRDSRKKCSVSVYHFLYLALWLSPGCCDQKQQLNAAAARGGALTSNLAWV